MEPALQDILPIGPTDPTTYADCDCKVNRRGWFRIQVFPPGGPLPQHDPATQALIICDDGVAVLVSPLEGRMSEETTRRATVPGA